MIDPDVPLAEIMTLQNALRQVTWPQSLLSLIFGICSVIILLLTSLGIFGVVANTVEQRSREYGIRMALGATPRRLTGDLLRRSLFLAASGSGTGLGIALLVTRFIPGTVFGIRATDAGVYMLGIIVIGLVFFIASFHPTRRIIRIDPIETLRSE